MTKRVGGRQGVSEEEVLELSWSHKKDADPRDIPPGAFFHMDVVALHLRQTGRVMHLRHFPNSLQNFFTEPGTYDLEALVAADNARPCHRIPIRFHYSPDTDELLFRPVNRARFPWWALRARVRLWWTGKRQRFREVRAKSLGSGGQ
jgi:hypothetical protein